MHYWKPTWCQTTLFSHSSLPSPTSSNQPTKTEYVDHSCSYTFFPGHREYYLSLEDGIPSRCTWREFLRRNTCWKGKNQVGSWLCGELLNWPRVESVKELTTVATLIPVRENIVIILHSVTFRRITSHKLFCCRGVLTTGTLYRDAVLLMGNKETDTLNPLRSIHVGRVDGHFLFSGTWKRSSGYYELLSLCENHGLSPFF